MVRFVALLLAVFVAAAAAYFFVRGGDTAASTTALVERLLTQGRTAEAQRELSAASSRLDAPTRDYLQGLTLLSQSLDAQAEEPLERAVASRPDDWHVVSAAASVRANLGKRAAALGLLDAHLARHPQDERAMATQARFLLAGPDAEHDAKKALALLDRIAALPTRTTPPTDPWAVRDEDLAKLRTQAEIELQHKVSALNSAREATARAPQDPEAWFQLGEAARRIPAGDMAIEAYRKAMALAPRERRYAEQLVMAIFELQGDGAEALRIAEQLLTGAPQDASLQILRARALVRVDRFDDADSVYLELKKRELPHDLRLQVLRNHAVLLADWKQGGRAGEYLDDARRELEEYRRLGGQMDDALNRVWADVHGGGDGGPQRK